MMDEIQKHLLETIADLHGIPEGAYNIRSNSKPLARALIFGALADLITVQTGAAEAAGCVALAMMKFLLKGLLEEVSRFAAMTLMDMTA